MRHCVPPAGRHLVVPDRPRRGGRWGVLVVVLLATVGAVLVLARPGTPPAPAVLPPAVLPSADVSDSRDAALADPDASPDRILAAWDRDRARAYAEADPDLLRTLYVPGSAAARSDVAMLRAYTARGLRVHGARMEVARITERVRRPALLRILVVERLGAAHTLDGEGRRLELPRDSWRERVLTFDHDGTRWRLASARDA